MQPPATTTLQPTIPSWIAGLQQQPDFSDFAIVCRGDTTIPVHRNIMNRISFFAQYFQKNPNARELRANANRDVVSVIVALIYTDKFEFSEHITAPDFIELVDLVDLWQLPRTYRDVLIRHADKVGTRILIDDPRCGQTLATLFDRESDRKCMITRQVYRYGPKEETNPWSNDTYCHNIRQYYIENPDVVELDMLDWPLLQHASCRDLQVDRIFKFGAYERLNRLPHHGYIARIICDTKQDLSSFLTPQQRRAFKQCESFGTMPATGIPDTDDSTLWISSYVPFRAHQYLDIGKVTGKDSRINSFTIRLKADVCPGTDIVFAYQPQGSNEKQMRASRIVSIRLFKIVDDQIQPYGDPQELGIDCSDYCIEFEAGTQMPYKGTTIFAVHQFGVTPTQSAKIQ